MSIPMTDDLSGHHIEAALLGDRFQLRRQWKAIQRARKSGQPYDRLLARFQQRLGASLELANRRRDILPAVDFGQDLPILAHRDTIISALDDHQVVVICGETGSGKSTQLPKMCLAAGYGVVGMIGHTQPRRIAARSVANRLAEELRRPLGQDVGFKIRFSDKTNRGTYIKLMTDGILLAETQGDRYLEQYEVIIIDEAHERSLNIDFLLGYIQRLLPSRPELRLIITSATIDADRFSRHFQTRGESAPIIEVSGRAYPVEVRYRCLESAGDEADIDLQTGIVDAVRELAEIDGGHMLIFLPTERDIRETAKRLRAEKLASDGRPTEILPLYARLSATEQNRVFQATPHRRIVLATNVAESSLTVPGIRYVIDTGTARISRYSPRSKVQRLPIEAVSRASADQRAGRCGRIGPGIAIRLYSEEDFAARPAYTTPEIQRTNLAAVILQAIALKLGRVEDFPFLDPPRADTIRDGYKTLFEIGAVDEHHELTPIGGTLSRLPVDPRLGRIIIAGHDEDCLHEVLIIASALELQDPRERPHDKRQAADEQHAKFADDASDFISYLRLWDFYHDLRENLSRNQLRRACQQNFLSFNRMREWSEIHRQLLQLAASHGFHPRKRRDNYNAIHRALLTGFLWGIAHRTGDYEYTGAGGVKFHLWPGSGLFASKPQWCVTAERIETTRRYGRTVARIDPKWIEPLASHLVKRHYSDPHWHEKSGRVMAWERVSLFGLPVVQRRRVPYGKIAPDIAREVFIRDGLAARQLRITDRFYTHNESIIAQLGKLAAKTRQAGQFVDTYLLERFYDQRIPQNVVDLQSLRRWLKNRKPGEPDVRLRIEDLLDEPQEASIDDEQFPDKLDVDGMTLPLAYHFAPGEVDDGVTVMVPEDGIEHLRPSRTGWVVPGLVEEKIVALIRSLPKPIRRNVIPAPDTAHKIAREITFGEGDFLTVVRQRLSTIAGQPIPADAFRLDKIPDHLQLNVRVIDADGKVKAQGRDFAELRQTLGHTDAQSVSAANDSRWHRDGIDDWDFGELPDQVTLDRGGIQVPAYPTLVDQPQADGRDSISLRLLISRHESRVQTRAGIRRLYILRQRKALRSQVNWLPDLDQSCLYAARLFDKQTMKRQLTELIADIAFFAPREGLPRDEQAFRQRLDDAAERIGGATQDVAKLLPKLFTAYHEAALALAGKQPEQWQYAFTDIEQQLTHLTSAGFLVATPWRWLQHYPRFFQAITYRIERLGSGSLNRDRRSTSEIAEYWLAYEQTVAANEEVNYAALDEFRWMLEEYRVSCFAQPLGTSMSISAKRLDKQWAQVNSLG